MKNQTSQIFAIVNAVFLILVFLSACSLGATPPADSAAPLPTLPTGQPGGLVPVDQYTAENFDLSGPQAWVQYPTSGAMLPSGTDVILEVHASDSVGISYIQIKLNGWELPYKAPTSTAADGNMRTVKVEQYYRAGNYPDLSVSGKYTVEVVAVNINGISSLPSTSTFCIGKCYDNRFYTPPAPPSIQDTKPTGTPVEDTKIEIVWFHFEPHSNNAGDCPDLVWEVKGTREGIYIDGELVPPIGRRKYCVCETEYHTMQIVAPDGKIINSWEAEAWVDEDTTCNPQALITPPRPGIAEQPDESKADTTGPYITGILAWGDCKFYGQAYLYEPSGVAQAKFGYNLNGGGWQWVWMAASNDTAWLSELSISVMDGINTPIGHIEYQFWAKDTLGNENNSEIYEYDYTSCSG